jgi:hypothetical protein
MQIMEQMQNSITGGQNGEVVLNYRKPKPSFMKQILKNRAEIPF